MYTTDGTGSSVPTFITKLWKLVEDSNYDDLIQWNQNGRSFIIHDQSKFAKELLPLYFKHSNMASFIRQLNMYGFRKVSNIENSGLRSERDDIEFYNQNFIKGKESELEFIKRKVSLKSSSQLPTTTKAGITSTHFKKEDVSDILSDITCIKGKQNSVDGVLTNMQRENEALWREVAILRQKHHKQQQIVEKLIQFLVSLVQNRGQMGIKRKAQLMIDDSEENREMLRNKMAKRTDFNADYNTDNPRSNGPIIHDITDDDIEENIINPNSPIITTNVTLAELSPNPQVLAPEINVLDINSSTDQLLTDSTKPIDSLDILDPLQQTIKELGLVADQPINVSDIDCTADVGSLLRTSLNTPPCSPSQLKNNVLDNRKNNSNEKPNDIKDLVISTQNNDQIITPLNSNAFNDHIEGIEAELDWLHDQLSSGLNIDTSTLLGVRSDSSLALTDNYWLKQLFSMEDNTPNSYPMTANNLKLNNGIIGNEVIQFNPNNSVNLFDELDLDTITASDQTQDTQLEEELLPNLDVVDERTVSF